MADRKISDLTALTTPASGDYVPIVDISEAAAASKNKRVTIQSLFQGIPVNVGIGTSSPRGLLSIANNAAGTGVVDSSLHFGYSLADHFGHRIVNSNEPTITAAGLLKFQHGTATAWVDSVVIDNLGRLLVGTSSSIVTGPQESLNQIVSNSQSELLSCHLGFNGAESPVITLSKSRNTTYGSYTVVQNGDSLGRIVFVGDDGSDYASQAGLIECQVDGTPGANDMPGRLVFSTTADGAASPTERMRITSSGNVGIGTTSPTTLLDVNADTVRVRTARTPASATATGAAGEICWDANYIYVCTATNTWKRAALSTW